MEPQYIVAIVAGGLFCLALLIYSIINAKRRKQENILRMRLDEAYSDNSLVKMEYDFAVYDEETERLLEKERGVVDKQITLDDVLPDKKGSSLDEVFVKLGAEGMEEITGNYNPDK